LTELIDLKWYEYLTTDCKAITLQTKLLTGTLFLKGKWKLGDRILKEIDKFEQVGYGNKTQKQFAEDLGISQGHISQVINFREKVGENFDSWMKENINTVNISWRKIVNEWIPKKHKEQEDKVRLKEFTKSLSVEKVNEIFNRLQASIKVLSALKEFPDIDKIYKKLEKLIEQVLNELKIRENKHE
jgi:transcriptional regulator with XRE-family HTH domain